ERRGHGDHGDDRRGGDQHGGATPAADAAGPAEHLVEVEVASTEPVEPARVALEVVAESWGHESSSHPEARSPSRARSVAIARLAWDLTVPTEMPSVAAVSASVSCS